MFALKNHLFFSWWKHQLWHRLCENPQVRGLQRKSFTQQLSEERNSAFYRTEQNSIYTVGQLLGNSSTQSQSTHHIPGKQAGESWIGLKPFPSLVEVPMSAVSLCRADVTPVTLSRAPGSLCHHFFPHHTTLWPCRKVPWAHCMSVLIFFWFFSGSADVFCPCTGAAYRAHRTAQLPQLQAELLSSLFILWQTQPRHSQHLWKVACNTTREPIIIILLSIPSNVSSSKSNNRCMASRVKQHLVFQTDLLYKYWKMSSIANIIISPFFLWRNKEITGKSLFYKNKCLFRKNKVIYATESYICSALFYIWTIKTASSAFICKCKQFF